MFWTIELAGWLEEAPWPAYKEELVDYAIRSGAPIEVLETCKNLKKMRFTNPWRTYGQITQQQKTFLFNQDEY